MSIFTGNIKKLDILRYMIITKSQEKKKKEGYDHYMVIFLFPRTCRLQMNFNLFVFYWATISVRALDLIIYFCFNYIL